MTTLSPKPRKASGTTSVKSGKLPVIGLIGGMGSGKSHIAAELAKRGGRVIAGDQLGHEALRQSDTIERLVGRWGRTILDPAGNIDRARISALVFADEDERRALEAVIHPYIERRLIEQLREAAEDPSCRFIVLDAAVLLEAGWQRYCTMVVFVDAPREERLARLARFRGWSEAELTERERAQLSLADKKARADLVIDNSGSLSDLSRQVDDLVAKPEFKMRSDMPLERVS